MNEQRNNSIDAPVRARLGGVAVAAVSLMLGACGSGGGAETVQLPTSGTPSPTAEYSGPPPSTDDVQSFKINVWDNLVSEQRCGACHGTNGQSPSFVHQDDVNMAYAAANPIVDLTRPSESLLVTKVGGGHNCWLTSDSACADILTTWISAWAGDAIAGGGNQIELQAPVIKDVGTSKSFPDDSSLFASTVHPVLTTYCATCHASDAAFPQQPYFAESDVDVAYDAVKSKIDLEQPDDSRLVVRLLSEFHNCWSNCPSDGATMLAAVDGMASQISATQVDPSLVVSKALTLFDGTIASGGNRYDNNVVAMYEFKTGSGTTAFDTSGVEPAIDLTFSGDVSWVGGWGIDIKGGKAQGSTAASVKLHDQIKATGEFSIEAWVVPGNVSQEDSRIVSYSAGVDNRNFTLGQTLYSYDFLNRSSVTDANGMPLLQTFDEDEDLQATLQHVVATYDPIEGRRIYVNGVFTDDSDDVGGGLLTDWNDTYALVLGNEVSSNRDWVGVLRLVAVHNRALTQDQILQNYDAGVGEKFFLLFSVGDLVDVSEAYVMFEVSQFDSYSYLFNSPTFISLDPDADPDGIRIQGVRVGVNGAEAPVSQTYINMDATVTRAAYSPAGQLLSSLGTVVPLEMGPAQDEFFLSFEIIGANTNVVVEASPTPPGPPADGEPMADIGLRTFDEINATMSQMTGVDSQTQAVKDTYLLIKQQLPAAETFGGFLASNQIAVAQLAIEYCNELVDNTALRSSYFPGFDFNASAAAAFDTPAERDLVLDPLLDGVLGINVASQPDPAAVRGELDGLIDNLTACGGSCAADRTETVVKAVCSGALGSAAMLLQ